MAHQSEQIVYTDEKRHKCLSCKAVRYESFMHKAERPEVTACNQFGNSLKQWKCNRDCQEKAY